MADNSDKKPKDEFHADNYENCSREDLIKEIEYWKSRYLTLEKVCQGCKTSD